VNRLKVEVRGDQLTYYVNDVRLARIQNRLTADRWVIGVMVQGRQRAAFDNLTVGNR
jgi:hypothetical protein